MEAARAALDQLPLSDIPEDVVDMMNCSLDSELAVLTNEALGINDNGRGQGKVILVLSQAIEALNRLTSEQELACGLLKDGGYNLKQLVGLLAYLITHSPTKDFKMCSLIAGRIYLTLIKAHDASAHGLVMPALLHRILRLLASEDAAGATLKRKNASGQRKGKRSNSPVGDEGDGDMEDVNEEDEAACQPCDEGTQRRMLLDLTETLHRISLSAFPDIVEELCMAFMAAVQRLSSISGDDALKTVQALLDPRHGDPETNSSQLLKAALTILAPGSVRVLKKGTKSESQVRKDVIGILKWMYSHSEEFKLGVHNRKSSSSILILLQHIAMKAPDKAEPRSQACEAIASVFSWLPLDDQQVFVNFLSQYSKNAKSIFRLFAAELCSSLCMVLLHSEDTSPHSRLLAGELTCTMIKRASDKVAAVRAKALSGLAVVLGELSNIADGPIKAEILRQIGFDSIVSPMGSAGQINMTIGGASPIRNDADVTTAMTPASALAVNIQDLELSQMDTNKSPTFGSSLARSLFSSSTDFFKLMHSRTRDEKSHVRKGALQVIESLAHFESTGELLDSVNLATLSEACRDISVAIRKQALMSLTQLLSSNRNHKELFVAWVSSVLPMCLDSESTVQDASIKLIKTHLIEPLASRAKKTEDWDLIAAVDNPEIEIYLGKFFSLLSTRKEVPRGLVKSLVDCLVSDVATERSASLFVLSSLFSRAPESSVDVGKVVDCWDKVKKLSNELDCQRILRILELSAAHLPNATAQALGEDILYNLKQFNVSAPVAKCMIMTLKKLCEQKAKDRKSFQALMDAWCSDVLTLCESAISDALFTPESADNPDLHLHLYIVGELVLVAFNVVPKRLATMVQAATTPPNFNALQPQVENAQSFRGVQLSPTARAHAFVALGKICLQDEALAKKSISVFVKELENKDPLNAAARNNILVVLCDLCKRYTSLVDRYVPVFSVCMKDPAEVVRRTAVNLVSHLLQEDYIKWKDSLFFRFMTGVVDDSAPICEFTMYCLNHLLGLKQPLLFSNHFVETVFYLNGYTDHIVYNKFVDQHQEQLFALPGEDNAEKRMSVYRLMLSKMNEEQKFTQTAKLCQDILGGFLDGLISADKTGGYQLLVDALKILYSKDIKIGSRVRSEEEEDLLPTLSQKAEAAAASAKKKLVDQLVKKNTIENIVPIIIELKHHLEEKRSPLLSHLMLYLQEVMKDFKDQVQEVLGADKQILQEIEFDLKQAERKRLQEVKEKRRSLGPLSPLVSPMAQKGPMSPTTPITSPAALRSVAIPNLKSPDTVRRKVKAVRPSSTKKSTPIGSGGADISMLSPEIVQPNPKKWRVASPIQPQQMDAEDVENDSRVLRSSRMRQPVL